MRAEVLFCKYERICSKMGYQKPIHIPTPQLQEDFLFVQMVLSFKVHDYISLIDKWQ